MLDVEVLSFSEGVVARFVFMSMVHDTLEWCHAFHATECRQHPRPTEPPTTRRQHIYLRLLLTSHRPRSFRDTCTATFPTLRYRQKHSTAAPTAARDARPRSVCMGNNQSHVPKNHFASRFVSAICSYFLTSTVRSLRRRLQCRDSQRRCTSMPSDHTSSTYHRWSIRSRIFFLSQRHHQDLAMSLHASGSILSCTLS